MSTIFGDLRVILLFSLIVAVAFAATQPPIHVDTERLSVSVDPATCRWSASVKGSPMQLNDVHFLPGDDACGWTVSTGPPV